MAYTIILVKPWHTATNAIIAGEPWSTTNQVTTFWDVWRTRHQDRRTLEARQRTRLQKMIAFARTHSEFYRTHYADCPLTIEDLGQLPPVTKPELMANFDASVTDPTVTKERVQHFVAEETRISQLLQNRYAVWTTSGTTGEFGIFLHVEDRCRRCKSRVARMTY